MTARDRIRASMRLPPPSQMFCAGRDSFKLPVGDGVVPNQNSAHTRKSKLQTRRSPARQPPAFL